MTEGMPESRERVHPALQWANERVGCCLEVVISLFSESHTSAPSAADLRRTDCTSKSLLFFLWSAVFSSEFHALRSIQTITRS